MMNVLGTKRIVFIVVLVLMNAGGGAAYKYMSDTIITKERELNGVKRQVQKRFAEVKKVREQFEALRGQVSDYVRLEKNGFFEEQDREMLRDVFFDAQKKSQVLRAKYNVSPYKEEKSKHITQPNLRWVNSDVSVQIEALDDIDVFSFIELVESKFPGYIQFKSVDIKRGQDLDTKTLTEIGSGKPVSLVSADVNFTWHAVPEKVEEQDQN